MAYKNILLIGAGGNLGPTILKALQSDPSFTITILSRQSSKSTFPTTIKVIKVADDYPASDLEAAFKGQDAIISLVGAAGIQEQTKFIDAASKVGVKRFFPSDFGSNLKDPKALENVPIFKPKVDVVDYLKKHEGTGLSWTSIVTGPFFDWGLKIGFLGFNITAKTTTIYDSGDASWSATNLSTIGRAIVAVLKNPEVSSNQYAFISSVTTSQNEVLAALEQVSGTKFTVARGTTHALLEGGKEKLAKGDFSAVGDLILGNLYSGAKGNDFEASEGTLNKKLGLAQEDLLDIVRHVVETGTLVA